MRLRYISQERLFIRSFFSGIGKTAVLPPSGFLVETGLGMLALGLIFFMQDVHRVTPGVIGSLSATWLICYVCGCLLMRPVLARFRPRYLLMLSTAGMSFFVLIILLFPSVAVSFVCYGLFGMAMSLFWPPLMGWLSFGIEGTELGRAMARQSLASNLGMIVSPLVTGLLSDISPIYPVYAATGTFLITLLLITGASLSLPRIRNDTDLEGSRSAAGGDTDQSTPLRFPAWIGLYATYVTVGAVIFIFPMYARVDLGLTKGAIGLLFLFRGLFSGITFVILGRLSFWHFRPLPMIAGLCLLLGLVAALSGAQSFPALIVVMMLLGPLIAISFSSSFFHGVSGSNSRARRMAIHEALLAGGLITGSAVGGQLYQRFSMKSVLLFCGCLLLLAITVQVVLSLWARKKGYRPMEQNSCSTKMT